MSHRCATCVSTRSDRGDERPLGTADARVRPQRGRAGQSERSRRLGATGTGSRWSSTRSHSSRPEIALVRRRRKLLYEDTLSVSPTSRVGGRRAAVFSSCLSSTLRLIYGWPIRKLLEDRICSFASPSGAVLRDRYLCRKEFHEAHSGHSHRSCGRVRGRVGAIPARSRSASDANRRKKPTRARESRPSCRPSATRRSPAQAKEKEIADLRACRLANPSLSPEKQQQMQKDVQKKGLSPAGPGGRAQRVQIEVSEAEQVPGAAHPGHQPVRSRRRVHLVPERSTEGWRSPRVDRCDHRDRRQVQRDGKAPADDPPPRSLPPPRCRRRRSPDRRGGTP
jgi:hypothetical protein